jgi:hypothetical protein
MYLIAGLIFYPQIAGPYANPIIPAVTVDTTYGQLFDIVVIFVVHPQILMAPSATGMTTVITACNRFRSNVK